MSKQLTPSARRKRTFLLVETAMLTAILIIMAFTPLGFLRIGPLELTLSMIPVIIGAVTGGASVGALLGLIFGLTSFIQCFMGSPLGTVLVSVSIPKCFIVCVLSRVLAGWLCGLIFSAVKKKDKKGGWSYVVAGISGSFLNTLFFLGLLALLFFSVQFTPEQAASLGGVDTVLKTVIAIAAGLNAPIEMVVCAVLGSVIGKALSKVLAKQN